MVGFEGKVVNLVGDRVTVKTEYGYYTVPLTVTSDGTIKADVFELPEPAASPNKQLPTKEDS